MPRSIFHGLCAAFLIDVTSELMRVPLRSNYTLPDTQHQRMKMVKETEQIKKCYNHFVAQLKLDLRKEEKDVAVIKNQLIMYDRNLKIPLTGCETLTDLFEILRLSKHSSFLDYELIKLLTDHGSDETRREFVDYKASLQKFLENRIIAQPSSEGVNAYAVVIDEGITNEITDSQHLQNRVKSILGHRSLNFIYCESGTQNHSSVPNSTIDENPLSAQIGFQPQPENVTPEKSAEGAVDESSATTTSTTETLSFLTKSDLEALAATTGFNMGSSDMETLMSTAMAQGHLGDDVDEALLQSLNAEITNSIVTLESVLSGRK